MYPRRLTYAALVAAALAVGACSDVTAPTPTAEPQFSENQGSNNRVGRVRTASENQGSNN